MDDLINEFLLESHEGLDCMERHLDNLRVGSDNSSCIAEIFRAIHTMKGTVGFLGLGRLGLLAHAGEALLTKIRDGTLILDEELKQLLLQLTDRLRAVLHLLDTRGHEGRRDADDDTEMIEALERVSAGHSLQEPVMDRALSDVHEREPEPDRSGLGIDPTVRVEVETLNRMMRLAEELEQARDRLRPTECSAQTAMDLIQLLNGISARLRHCVMQARMQPVGHLFQRYPRLARDVATSCGKQVTMEFHGGETGFDKSLLSAMRDPLTHAVRNAIDHGIESPQMRCALGKPPTGRVVLKAWQDAGQIVVEVQDDGAGIDYAKVRRSAAKRELITPERAVAMSDGEALELLFLPGFSTHETATMISGRGVGMDVVRSNIEQVGGTVELQSTPGVGTIVRMRVPLTLSVQPTAWPSESGRS